MSGTLSERRAAGVLLLAELEPVQPERWNPVSRRFTFRVAIDDLVSYLRLGFVTPMGLSP